MQRNFLQAKPCVLANPKLCNIQMLLNIERSGEQDKEPSPECLVNTNPLLLKTDFQIMQAIAIEVDTFLYQVYTGITFVVILLCYTH